MIRAGILALSLVSSVCLPATAYEPEPFKAPLQCKALLGKDFETGLKTRLFEMLEKGNWFAGDRSYLASDLTSILYDLPLSEAEIRDVMAHLDSANTRAVWELKLAEATGDWSPLYEFELVNRSSDFIRIAAYREALMQAEAGETITALEQFRSVRNDLLLSADSDTTRDILEGDNMEAFIGVGILRALVMHEFDDEAQRFVDEANVAGLQDYLAAMIDGRMGDKAALDALADNPTWGRLDHPTMVGVPVSKLGEYIFQALAANRRELARELQALGGEAAMLHARSSLPLVIDAGRRDALAFAYTMTPTAARGYSGDDSILNKLAENGDVASLEALLPLAEPDGFIDHKVRNALVYALVRRGELTAALEMAGDMTINELGTNWLPMEGGVRPGMPGEGPGQGILPALVIFGDTADWPAWRERMNEEQLQAMDLLIETNRYGFDATEDYMAKHPDRQHFGPDPWRHINYFDMTASFAHDTPEAMEIWYDYIFDDPEGRNLFMSEWFWLVREQCLGWAYVPSGRTEAGVVDYSYRGSVFAGGVGGLILLTSN